MTNARRVFEIQTLDQRMTHLQRENAKLKTLIGDLTVELKKRRGVGMRRGPYAKVGERTQGLLAHILSVKADHPFWAIAESGLMCAM